MARPVIGRGGGAARARGAALGPAVARAAVRRVRAGVRARVGAAHASAVSSGTAGLHLALRAVGVTDGDEVITSPFSFVATANVVVYERARPVFADIDPVTLNLVPAPRRPRSRARTAAMLPVHIFGYPADIAAFERFGLPIVEDACEALGAVTPTAPGRRPRPPGGVRLLPQQAADDRRGRDGAAPIRRSSSGWTPSATRAARRTWTGSTTTVSASITGSRTSPARSGSPSWSGSTRCWPARARVAALLRRGARARIEGLDAAVRRRGGDRRGWFVYVVQLPRGVDRDDAIRALARTRGPGQAVLPGDPPDDATTASGSATARASSRSVRTSPLVRSRCRSSRR